MSGPNLAPGAEGKDALGTAGKLPALLNAGATFYSLPTPSASATRLM